MFVIVNGKRQQMSEPLTLAALLLALSPRGPFAVARNNEFIPRCLYNDCVVEPGDNIDIIQPTVGG